MQERAHVLYHRAQFGGARISLAARVAKTLSFFVCWFVRHAFERQRLCAGFSREDVGPLTAEIGSGVWAPQQANHYGVVSSRDRAVIPFNVWRLNCPVHP